MNTTWNLDQAHSEIQFRVRHMMITNVTGYFKKFNAVITTNGDDFSNAKINFSADIDSISTNNEQRDGHLKNTDFFDIDNHPQLKFESDKLEKAGGDDYKMHGTLTMRGVSKPITLNVTYGGTMQDPWGNTRAGFTITGKIDRTDFGVSFGAIAETGGAMLAHDVHITCNVQFTKQLQEELTTVA